MDLIKQYIEKTKLVSHQIESFDDFVNTGIQRIVNQDNTINVSSFTIEFGDVFIDKPYYIDNDRTIRPLYPNEARKKNITYDGTIYLRISITKDNQTSVYDRISIGKLPIMIGSSLCNLTENNKIEKEECENDPGGYFIMKGKEKVLVGQLRPAYNKVYVSLLKNEKYKHVAEIRTMNYFNNSVMIQARVDEFLNLYFSLPYIKDNLPAGLIFKALDISEEMMLSVCKIDDKYKKTLIQQYNSVTTTKNAIEIASQSLSNKDSNYINYLFDKEIFYHIGFLNKEKTSLHLGYILKKLTETVDNKRIYDDKNNLSNKRLELASSLIGFLFQNLFKQFLKTINNQIMSKKNPDPLVIIKSSNNITNGLHMCFSTGNWTTQKNPSFIKQGVSQVLSRQNYGSTLSHLRRIMYPIGNEGKNIKMRMLQSSHYGFICPYETPEGSTVGIVTNLALTVQITIDIPLEEIIAVIKNFKTFSSDFEEKVLILINGMITGSTEKGLDFVNEFNEYRKSDLIDYSVSIAWLRDENEIHISSDQGRLIRPLFAVHKNKILYKKSSLDEAIKNHEIVFRDVMELESATVALDKSDLLKNKCDYLEISPAGSMMGIMASVIPFSNHSQSPRIAYQASMGKQAIGMPCLNYKHRYDTTLHILNYVQKPITSSKIMNIIKFDEMCHGALPIVAIMTFNGFNQEDSIILNKSSIDRGLFVSTTYKSVTEEEKKRGNSDFETICLPKFEYRKREYNYSLLKPNGVIKENKSLWVKKGDVLIGKTISKLIKNEENDSRNLTTIDISIVVKHDEEGYIDSVLDTMANDGTRVVKIRVRTPRRPEIGDKFASNTAQKGTCGMIYSQEDMPFSAEGITPDLIINPHAIPSRMTINLLIETCFNLFGCFKGYQDATAFEHYDVQDELNEKLKELKWDEYSTTMYCGFTGKKYPSKIFIGPMSFQRLKHMVSDKLHARLCGPVDTMTHQPVAGRAKDGGLRFGEINVLSLTGGSGIVKFLLIVN